jgi:hypothetical protein
MNKYEERFWEKVDKRGADECWLWTGALAWGYGKVHMENGMERAHRVSYRIVHGDIPEGLCVCHTCDVRNCVNPSHLFLGTRKDNQQDMMRKGRSTFGERHASSKLKEKDVLAIIDLYKSGNYTQRELGNAHGISQRQIHRIVTKKSWKHLHVEEGQMSWISVEDNKPTVWAVEEDFGRSNLIMIKGTKRKDGSYFEGEGYYLKANDSDCFIEFGIGLVDIIDATHWQPIGEEDE